MINIAELIQELEQWSETYHFNFQFWGEGNNNVFISKDGVELYSTGGLDSIADIIIAALVYVRKINRIS